MSFTEWLRSAFAIRHLPTWEGDSLFEYTEKSFYVRRQASDWDTFECFSRRPPSRCNLSGDAITGGRDDHPDFKLSKPPEWHAFRRRLQGHPTLSVFKKSGSSIVIDRVDLTLTSDLPGGDAKTCRPAPSSAIYWRHADEPRMVIRHYTTESTYDAPKERRRKDSKSANAATHLARRPVIKGSSVSSVDVSLGSEMNRLTFDDVHQQPTGYEVQGDRGAKLGRGEDGPSNLFPVDRTNLDDIQNSDVTEVTFGWYVKVGVAV